MIDKEDDVNVIKYNILTNKWENIQNLSIENLKTPKSLKIITYNVWFENHNFEERLELIFKSFENINADIICLQEVTKPFFTKLLEQNFIKNNYFISEKTEPYWYDIVILSKFKFNIHYLKYPSAMGRNLLFGTLNFYEKTFVIATSHFESLDNALLRKAQLNKAFKELNKFDYVCLLGDFNFDNEIEEKNIDENFEDIWKVLNKDKIGFTQPDNDEFDAWRPDKILLKKNNFIKAKSINIFGKEELKKYLNPNSEIVKTPKLVLNINPKIIKKEFIEKKPIPPILLFENEEVKTASDHYGLEVEFEFIGI